MNLKEFLKDKIIYIIMLIVAIITIEIFLMIYNFGAFVKIYIPISISVSFSIGLFVEYFRKSKYYSKLFTSFDELDKKYLITEIISEPDFIEGKLFNDIIKETNKSMIENVNFYRYLQEEYKDYIELWIHEVRIPISTSKLIVENNKNGISKSLNEELDKIEDYTEQALFYARSNNVEKDYVIRKLNLREVVNNVIKKNQNQLLSSSIKIEIKDVDREIYSDSKWIVFILSQIISNSIKYSKDIDRKIIIFSEEKQNKVNLFIQDNGIGINTNEILKVFDKGFTGTNGRMVGKKSTGIGLYLCKKLCNRLGLGIEIDSEENRGTQVKIIFPKNSLTNVF